MSNRAASFVEEWISENAVKPIEGAPAGDESEAALYVYPQAPYWPAAGGVAWNVDPAGVDFPYFDALIADLGRKFCVDTTRPRRSATR